MIYCALRNQSGEIRELNIGDAATLGNQSGFGFDLANTFTGVASGFYISDEKYGNAAKLVGDLLFLQSTAYADYREFVSWLGAASRLWFIYAPYGETQFMREVVMTSISKSIRSRDGALRCPVTFTALTPWYTETNAAVILTQSTANALVFDKAGSVFDSAVWAGSIYPGARAEVFPEGQIDSAFRLTMRGAINDPIISVVGAQSGKTYGRAEVTSTFVEGEGLILDTTVDGAGIWKLELDGTMTDIIDAVNLYYDPFPMLPVTETCFINIEASGGTSGIDGATDAVIYRYYRTV